MSDTFTVRYGDTIRMRDTSWFSGQEVEAFDVTAKKFRLKFSDNTTQVYVNNSDRLYDIIKRKATDVTTTAAKISDVKVGDKVKVLAIRDIKNKEPLNYPEVLKTIGTVLNVKNVCGDSIKVPRPSCGTNWALFEGDFELITDFAGDEVIAAANENISKYKTLLEIEEKRLELRKAELSNPKPTLPEIELRWLKYHGAPQYGIDDACKFGSLAEAYDALKEKRHRSHFGQLDCTPYGLWCHNKIGSSYSTNPFRNMNGEIRTAFKIQLDMLAKIPQ